MLSDCRDTTNSNKLRQQHPLPSALLSLGDSVSNLAENFQLATNKSRFKVQHGKVERGQKDLDLPQTHAHHRPKKSKIIIRYFKCHAKLRLTTSPVNEHKTYCLRH
ncbi:hypothetical protein BaRGS_00034614 [Batillaria attramentaria]|uniref:Uncharacterized protein n=1 Tax=Batillaria attramentaria TaxID=370345 RepID=A0ABD0JGW7_9CAEN